MPSAFLTPDQLLAALPDVTSPVKLKGLDGLVEIVRDRWGIPHVRAQSAHDAFFGQGFATAQDRLWQMDYDRRRAYGRWAEYAGPTALPGDLFMRRCQIEAGVQADYRSVNGETRAMLDAYAEGVNAFIESTERLPVEYSLVEARPERWQPWDGLAVFKVRHIDMGVFEMKQWRAELIRRIGPERTAKLFPGYTPGQLVIIPPLATYDGPALDGLKELQQGIEAINRLQETEGGSNNWVISGNRTASRKPLLAGDPHRGLDTPNVYYQNHVACPEFDVIGLSIPGCPAFPHFGHNAEVAWAITHAGADYQDLYVERFRGTAEQRNSGDGAGALEYEFKGEWLRAETREDEIRVRGGEPVRARLAKTHHGPVIAGDPAKGYALVLRYTALLEPNLGFQCLPRILKARNIEELDEAQRDWVDPCNNYIFADTAGNIGYLNRGRVPIRSMDNAWVPVPGWTGEHEWEGYIPFEKLSRARNPENGFIVTANNRIPKADYPYYIALDFAPEFRAKRIVERLQAIPEATADGMAAVHAERVSIPALQYLPLLRGMRYEPKGASGAQPLKGLVEQALAILERWDGSMERESAAAAIYTVLRERLDRRLAAQVMGPEAAQAAVKGAARGGQAHLRRLSAWFAQAAADGDAWPLPEGVGWEQALAQALEEAVAYLRGRLGDDNVAGWTWGRVHGTRPQHTLSAAFPELAAALNPPATPMGGDGDTPQAATASLTDPYVITSTSVARYAIDVADWDNSRWISPLGASGHPGSTHYADQAPIWAEVQMIPMLYSWERVRSEAESRQVLSPEG